MVQARQGGWAEKRETYRARASSKYIEHRADHAALLEAEVRNHAIDAIDEAITRFRSDLRATKKVVLADGSVAEEPAMRITPRDLVMVIDRLQVLFGRPSTISEGRGFAATVTTEALPRRSPRCPRRSARGGASVRAGRRRARSGTGAGSGRSR